MNRLDEIRERVTREKQNASVWSARSRLHADIEWVLAEVERLTTSGREQMLNVSLHANEQRHRAEAAEAKVARVEALVTTTIEGELNGQKVPIPLIWASDLRDALRGDDQ